MLHDEIVSGIYAKLKSSVSIPIYKFYFQATGERIVILLKANTKEDVFQKAQVWIEIFAPTVDNLPDTARLTQLQHEVENALQGNISLPTGELLILKPLSIDGPFVDPESATEAYLILRYKVIVKE